MKSLGGRERSRHFFVSTERVRARRCDSTEREIGGGERKSDADGRRGVK